MARILLVEDEDLVQAFLVRCLERYDFKVETFFDGESGLQRLKQSHFDLILTDCRLPGISGIEVVKDLRKAGLKSRVVGMSAEHNRAPEMLKAGADLFLEKPFSIENLEEAFRKLGMI